MASKSIRRMKREYHGLCGHPVYKVWSAMIGRCTNPRHPQWSAYGGRGIAVCDRWRHSPKTFIEDMGPRHVGRMVLDRTNNDGPYSPENCRWTTYAESIRNRRNTRFTTFFGRKILVFDLASEVGIPQRTLYNRIIDLGMSAEEAVAMEKRSRPNGYANSPVVQFRGECVPIVVLAKRHGIPRTILRERLARGYDVERAISRPIAHKRRRAHG